MQGCLYHNMFQMAVFEASGCSGACQMTVATCSMKACSRSMLLLPHSYPKSPGGKTQLASACQDVEKLQPDSARKNTCLLPCILFHKPGCNLQLNLYDATFELASKHTVALAMCGLCGHWLSQGMLQPVNLPTPWLFNGTTLSVRRRNA